MFAYPWIEDTAGSNEALVELGRLNMALIAKTKQLLKSSMQNDNCENGSCDYNLTLINRCLPSGEYKIAELSLITISKSRHHKIP